MITVPPKQIEELGWGEGEFLESEVTHQELAIRRENSEKVEKRREIAKRAWETRKRGEK